VTGNWKVHHVAEAKKQKISTERVRAGSSEHVVRYVLSISLGLAVVAMIVILALW
jgi:hypothetical protein